MEEPQYGRGFFVKDYHFYKGNENTWNRPSWSSRKNFNMYHKKEILKNKELKHKVDEIISAKKEFESRQTAQFVNHHRKEVFTRLMDRKIERLVVQNKCKQAIETHPSEFALYTIENMQPEEINHSVMNKSGIRSHLKTSNSNLWNDFTKLTSKGASLLMPMNILQKDEFATTSITNRIREEKMMNTEREFKSRIVHDHIYNHEKHLKMKNTSRYSQWGGESAEATNKSGNNFFLAPHDLSSNAEAGGRGAEKGINVAYVVEGDSEKFNLTGKTYSMAKSASNISRVGKAEAGKAWDVNPEDYTEYRGLHVPSFNKDVAAVKVPYTQFVMEHSQLARQRVDSDRKAASVMRDAEKVKDIRLNKKIKSHLPLVKPPKNHKVTREAELDDKEVAEIYSDRA